MRQLNHIILDFYTTKSNVTAKYWASAFLTQLDTQKQINNKSLLSHDKYDLTSSANLHKQILQALNATTPTTLTTINTWYNLININFLRKEKLYTKLKYSRSPAFDIVSGGIAALLAGLLGFLVSEKFGMELVDSGDFYYVWMYAVFLAFSLRPLLTVIESDKSLWHVLSLRRVYQFYLTVIVNTFKFLK